MPTIADTIRAALKRPQPTTEQAAATVDLARRADADARAAVDRAQAVVSAGYMDAESKRSVDRATLAAARDAAEDASLLLAEVERRHAVAIDAGEQARRMGLYTAAKTRAAVAAADLARDYPALVKGALKMLRSLAEAQRDVETANAQLPAGSPPLDDPEVTVRGTPFRPQEVVSEAEVVLWTRHDMATPVDEPFQSEIQEARDGWGIHPNNDEPNYLRVRYLRREVRRTVAGRSPSPLAAAIALPALTGDTMAWGTPEPEYGPNPVLVAVLAGHAHPDNVLAKMAEMNAAPPAKRKDSEPLVEVEWEMLGYEGPTPLKPIGYKTYHRDENGHQGQPEANPRPIGTDFIGLPGLQAPTFRPPSPRLVQPSGQPTRAGRL